MSAQSQDMSHEKTPANSMEQYQDNMKLLEEIFSTPEAIEKHNQMEKDSMAATNYEYRMDMNVDNLNVDSLIEAQAKAPLDTNKKLVSYMEIRDFNDTLSDNEIRKGIETSGIYHVDKNDQKSQEVRVTVRDTDRDGKGDLFGVTDETYGKNYLTQRHGLFGRHIHIDPKQRTENINTDSVDLNHDNFAAREEIMSALGDVEGTKLLEQLDQKYAEIIKEANQIFMEKEVAPSQDQPEQQNTVPQL
jgi:hypothetical protein